MKKNITKIFIGIICLCLVIYIIGNSPRYAEEISDLTGGNDYWHASLNIDPQSRSELIIQPIRDDFDIPTEISIDINVNSKSVYTDKLKYIPDKKFRIGQYTKVRLISKDYFKKDLDNIKLIIKYKDQKSIIIFRKSPDIQ